MAELLIWSRTTRDEDVASLSALLAADVPGCEVAFDQSRVLERMSSQLEKADRAADLARERRERESATPAGEIFDVVALVLPGAATVLIEAVVGAALRWLRGLRESPYGERDVLIYGPDGEPLRMIRVRSPKEPEVVEPPWPLPTRKGGDAS